jgi:catechol 2,3-dioxygenase-like lactoylglutathione lyase family enzyme
VTIAVRRLQHVNLLVDDLDAAEHFYGALLGWPHANRPDFGFPGAWFDLGHGQLHLVVVDRMPEPSGAHFAVEVDDLDEVVGSLERAGVKVSPGGGTRGAGRQAFCQDPAGNLIEFNQPD